MDATRVGGRVIVDNALYGGGEEGLVTSGIVGSERDGGALWHDREGTEVA